MTLTETAIAAVIRGAGYRLWHGVPMWAAAAFLVAVVVFDQMRRRG